MKFRRGDIVLVVAPGAFGKGRPAVVLQADLFNTDPPSVTVCLVTTHLQTGNPIRVALPANRTEKGPGSHFLAFPTIRDLAAAFEGNVNLAPFPPFPDYAVMERTADAAVVPAVLGWSDIGSRPMLWEATAKDAEGNAVRKDVDSRA